MQRTRRRKMVESLSAPRTVVPSLERGIESSRTSPVFHGQVVPVCPHPRSQGGESSKVPGGRSAPGDRNSATGQGASSHAHASTAHHEPPGLLRVRG